LNKPVGICLNKNKIADDGKMPKQIVFALQKPADSLILGDLGLVVLKHKKQLLDGLTYEITYPAGTW